MLQLINKQYFLQLFMFFTCLISHVFTYRRAIMFGGNGLIGSATVKKLVDMNIMDEIVIVGRGNGYYDSMERIKPFVKLLICDRRVELSKCPQLMNYIQANSVDNDNNNNKFETVVDFTSISEFHSKELLKYLNSSNVQYFIHISTDSLYDVSRVKKHPNPTVETDAGFPTTDEEIEQVKNENKENPMYINPVFLLDFKVDLNDTDDLDKYGRLKLNAENEIVKSHKEGLTPDFAMLRLPAVIGARDTTYRWWMYQLWLRLSIHIALRPVQIPTFLETKPMSLVYVEDIADLITTLISTKPILNDAFNIAIEEAPTLQELLTEISNGLGLKNAKFVSTIKGEENIYSYPDVRRGPIDITKAKKVLGFTPTPLKRIIRNTIPFYEDAMSKKSMAGERDVFLIKMAKSLYSQNPREFLDKVSSLYRISLNHLKHNFKDEF